MKIFNTNFVKIELVHMVNWDVIDFLKDNLVF